MRGRFAYTSFFFHLLHPSAKMALSRCQKFFPPYSYTSRKTTRVLQDVYGLQLKAVGTTRLRSCQLEVDRTGRIFFRIHEVQ